jgi:hypothetical protein
MKIPRLFSRGHFHCKYEEIRIFKFFEKYKSERYIYIYINSFKLKHLISKMETREILVSYLDKGYLDSQLPERKNTPYFQLSEGETGLASCVSEPKDFFELALDLLDFLDKPQSFEYAYRIKFSKDALPKIKEVEKKFLEKLVALRNDLVMSRGS